jgi:hypothetical protein
LFTNARVVHLFYDGEDDKAIQTAREVLNLIVKRKEGVGPGVTPGKVHFLAGSSSDVYSDIPGLLFLPGSSSLSDDTVRYGVLLVKHGAGLSDQIYGPW